jgi:hypothetical protein
MPGDSDGEHKRDWRGGAHRAVACLDKGSGRRVQSSSLPDGVGVATSVLTAAVLVDPPRIIRHVVRFDVRISAIR